MIKKNVVVHLNSPIIYIPSTGQGLSKHTTYMLNVD